MTTTNTRVRMILAAISAAAVMACLARPVGSKPSAYNLNRDSDQGVVHCANLIYGHSKTSVCFSDEFLTQLRKDSNIRANRRFCPVKLGSDELFQYPFAVMTGEGSFSLTEVQRRNLRAYLTRGGFLVASPGCSSSAWDASFRDEVKRVFPDVPFKKIPMSHPIFHTVYDIERLDNKQGVAAYLETIEYEGKVVLVYSREGLNDTANAGPGCCCCGGNEIYNARQVNANLLAYALTH